MIAISNFSKMQELEKCNHLLREEIEKLKNALRSAEVILLLSFKVPAYC